MGNFGNKKRNKNRHKKVDMEKKSEVESSEEPDQREKSGRGEPPSDGRVHKLNESARLWINIVKIED